MYQVLSRELKIKVKVNKNINIKTLTGYNIILNTYIKQYSIYS